MSLGKFTITIGPKGETDAQGRPIIYDRYTPGGPTSRDASWRNELPSVRGPRCHETCPCRKED